MLSNYLTGNYKFVLFIDNFGIEPNSKSILKKLLVEQNQSFDFYTEYDNNNFEKKCLIIDSFSKLELVYSEKEIFNIIQELKLNDNVLQLFGWISRKNVQSKILIPFLEHMSNLAITINDIHHLTIITKNKHGLVKFKEYYHELSLGKTSIKDLKKENFQQAVSEVTDDIENLGTFKISQKADELEAKRNLKLPFEIIDLPNTSVSMKQEGKIIYTPDSVDDFDEEDDPDNDLQF